MRCGSTNNLVFCSDFWNACEVSRALLFVEIMPSQRGLRQEVVNWKTFFTLYFPDDRSPVNDVHACDVNAGSFTCDCLSDEHRLGRL